MSTIIKNRKRYYLAVITALLLILFSGVPIPNYYIEAPGSAENVANFISVDGTNDKTAGSFMLTTVSMRQATVASLLVAKFSQHQLITTKQEIMGDNTSSEEYNLLQEYYMQSSENTAKQVALNLADVNYTVDYQGIYVLSVTEDSNFKDKLVLGDVITAIDGHSFQSSAEFVEYVSKQKIGQTITINLKRDGEEIVVSGELGTLSTTGGPGIGIQLTDKTVVSSDKEITIDAGNIRGPSAGLMFTLETYQLLSNQDLRQGRAIAGTGTISSDGTVGRIGGIDKKVVAANQAGAEIFFAPDDEVTDEMLKIDPSYQSNYQEAVAAAAKINTKMQIVPVKTVQDAIDYLQNN